jgi:YHS domain-containing protein
MTRALRNTAIGLTLLAAAAASGRGQHTGHSAGPPAETAPPGCHCAGTDASALALLDRIGARLEAARQSNSPAKMRAAMDELQAGLGELKSLESRCGGAPESRTAEPPAKPTDPVCGMSVDPRSEFRATHGGKVYLFCSAGDRDKFLQEPSKFLKP